MDFKETKALTMITHENLDSVHDELSENQRKLVAIGMNKSWRMPAFKAKYFVGHANISPYGAVKQYFLELNSREELIIKQEYDIEMNDVEIDELEAKMKTEQDPFDLRRIKIEHKHKVRNRKNMKRQLTNAREERLMYAQLIEAIDQSEYGKLPNGMRLIDAVYDPEISEELEREYWVQRLGKQAAMDMIAYGRVGVGNMDSIVMLNKEDQRNALQHAADIAITNESRMNHIRDESVKRLENGIDQHEMIKQLGLTKD